MSYLGASPKQRSLRTSPVFKCVGGELTIPLQMMSQDSLLLLNGVVIPYGGDWTRDVLTGYPVMLTPAEKDDEFQILDLAGFSFSEMLSRAGGNMTGAINGVPAVAVTSAGNITLAVNSERVILNPGAVTTISDFGAGTAGMIRRVKMMGSYIIVNSANIVLPRSQNLVTQLNDCADFYCSGGNKWECDLYTRMTSIT